MIMSRFTTMKTLLIIGAIIRPAALLAAYLLIADQHSSGRVLICILAAIGASILPALCLDPSREAQTKSSSAADRQSDWIAQSRFLCSFLLLLWVVEQPEVDSFIHSLAPRLWDWQLITCAAIFCGTDLFRSLRFAIAFRPSHLYPELSHHSKQTSP